MTLHRLEISALRNLQSVQIDPHPQFNWIVGVNGSGKTSILEAIHLLGMGRSFRNHRIDPVINYEAEQCQLFARIHSKTSANLPIGLQRSRQGAAIIKIDGETTQSLAQLARELPLQLINPDSYRLLEGGPKYRRQFLDWGVFHVEHSFIERWQRLQRILRQRNAALKEGRSEQEIRLWDEEFVELGEWVHQQREQYLSALKAVFSPMLDVFLPQLPLDWQYLPGWDPARGLAKVLTQSLGRDRQLGYTYYGPQRADIVLLHQQQAVKDVLSRGQQKLAVCALKLAQGILLQQKTDQAGVYLLDDLPSELDNRGCARVIEQLASLGSQVFITGIHPSSFEVFQQEKSGKMFHVEHGKVKLVV